MTKKVWRIQFTNKTGAKPKDLKNKEDLFRSSWLDKKGIFVSQNVSMGPASARRLSKWLLKAAGWLESNQPSSPVANLKSKQAKGGKNGSR